MARRTSYIILNPYDTDAMAFIRAMSFAFGWRPICIYTDAKKRFYTEREFPHLRVFDPEEVVVTTMDNLLDVVDELNERYDIRAVIPFREHYLEACAAILERCDVDWMTGTDLRLFRDKHRQKTEISRRDPSVRVPENRIVQNVDDVFNKPLPNEFVIKPNDGAGSANLGFFTNGDRELVSEHLRKAPGTTWILEEMIDGPEFRINGLIRRDGTVQILYMSEYLPLQVTPTFTLAYSAEVQLRTDDERWDQLADYTERILHASGLWGSPFHLEVKVDQHGPAMVDLGGRVASDGTGLLMSILHPDRPDLYAVAARDYVGDNDMAMSPPSYDEYNRSQLELFSGISHTEGLLTGIDGIEEVEAAPEFVQWITKPSVGDWITQTTDLRSCPYIALFLHNSDRDGTIRLRDWLYETLTLHTEAAPKPGPRLNLLKQKMTTRASWELHSRSSQTSPLETH